MPVNEQDARAFAYLMRRYREEYPSPYEWHQPGIAAESRGLIGGDLDASVQAVRHARDPEARGPGVIRRPYIPPSPEPVRERDVAPVRSRCTACSGRRPEDCPDDHEFTPWRPRETDLAEVVAEVKAHIHPTVPSQEEASA